MSKVVNRKFFERIKTDNVGVVAGGGSSGGGGISLDVQEGTGTGNAFTEFTFDSGLLTLNKGKTLVDTAAVDQTIAGNKTFSNTVVAPEFQGPSDERLKDIVDVLQIPVEKIAEAPSVLFRWNDGTDEDLHIGTIAQHWQRIDPRLVRVDDKGYLTICYPALAMVSAISTARELVELRKEVSELKAMIQTMKSALQNQ